MIIVVATGNSGKVREIKEIMGHLGQVLSMKEVGCSSDPEESGSTFTENAFIKAEALLALLKQKAEYRDRSDLVVIADDSGLCVEALDGAPGIYSARYAGEGASDRQLIGKLLREMQGIPEHKRQAKFVCAAVAICGDGRRFSEEGTVSGRILQEPMGQAGFGYDPVFWHPEYQNSFGLLSEEEKNAVSHRGMAFRKLSEQLSLVGLSRPNIVLVEPEIPQNTGTIARTCAATGAKLHLVRPLGFEINDKYLKRAGLDYWSEVDISYYDSFQQVKDRHPEGTFFYASTKARQTYAEVAYPRNPFLVFGKETKGLPEALLRQNPQTCIRIPMRESIRSLNLSNSVNIILYEVYRQSHFAGLCGEGELTEYHWEEQS